jgi:hypothetical protein
MRASLTYVLPHNLDNEIYQAAVQTHNSLPTKQTLIKSPYELFRREVPAVPSHPFGLIAMFYHPRNDDPTFRAELGIFLSKGDHQAYIRAYYPSRLRRYQIIITNHHNLCKVVIEFMIIFLRVY